MSETGLGDLLRQLVTDSATLVRQELALLRQETKEALETLKTSVTMLAAGVLLALLALGTWTAAAVIGLGQRMGYGAAAAVVAAVLTVVAAIAVAWGAHRLRAEPLKPEKTLESLEEGKQWMKDLT
jgi:uncharacterized membrane protein YqjE